MTTQHTARRVSALSLRSSRRHRVGRPVSSLSVGQCFDIEIERGVDGWQIRIPEIAGVTFAVRRAEVEIAARTGIPIGYIAVRIRD